LSSARGDGNDTPWYQENDLPRESSTRIPNEELDPTNSARILLWPGNYTPAVRITRQSRLEKWGGTGNVHIGP